MDILRGEFESKVTLISIALCIFLTFLQNNILVTSKRFVV